MPVSKLSKNLGPVWVLERHYQMGRDISKNGGPSAAGWRPFWRTRFLFLSHSWGLPIVGRSSASTFCHAVTFRRHVIKFHVKKMMPFGASLPWRSVDSYSYLVLRNNAANPGVNLAQYKSGLNNNLHIVS